MRAPQPIDLHFQGMAGVIAVYLLDTEDGPALVDVGPASTLDALEAGLRAHGHRLEDLRHLLLTHIHLDHAGAAGEIVARSGARVYVHSEGARHLARPERLLASAGQIYGDRMEALWGHMTPVPEASLQVLEGGETLELGGLTVEPIYTPGHAVHHLAYQVGPDLFLGDVGGVRLEASQTPRAPTPPPDIELDNWRRSIAALRKRDTSTLHLAHFGSYPARAAHWDGLLDSMRRDAERARELLAAEPDPQLRAERFGAAQYAELEAENPDLARRFAFASPPWMSLQGLERYWTRRERSAP